MSHAHLTPTLSRRLQRAAPRRRQRGFSLLEALVSIVILSFGLLGVAGLQASALKYSRDARNQSVAVNLAREMAEMIRSNARESGKPTDENEYLKGLTRPILAVAEGDSAPPPTCLNEGRSCADAAELAQDQVADWRYRVGQALPGAYIAVCKDSEPYEASGVPKSWDEGCDDSGDIIAIKMGWEREDASGKVKAANEAWTGEDKARPFIVLPVTPAGQQ